MCVRDRADALQKAIERFREAKKGKVDTIEERQARAKRNNEVAVHALGWKLRSEKAEEKKKNRFLREDQ